MLHGRGCNDSWVDCEETEIHVKRWCRAKSILIAGLPARGWKPWQWESRRITKCPWCGQVPPIPSESLWRFYPGLPEHPSALELLKTQQWGWLRRDTHSALKSDRFDSIKLTQSTRISLLARKSRQGWKFDWSSISWYFQFHLNWESPLKITDGSSDCL